MQRPIVVSFGALGDLVMLTPLFELLHARYGEPCLLVTSGTWAEALFRDGHPHLSGMIRAGRLRKPYWLAPRQWAAVRALKRERGPVYVCYTPDVRKLGELLRRAGIAPDRCVSLTDFAREPDTHQVDLWRFLGQQTPAAFAAVPRLLDVTRLRPALQINAADRLDLERWLAASGLADADLVLLQPGNKRTLKRGARGLAGDPKHWPAENWVRVCRAIHDDLPAARIILCGAPSEASLLSKISTQAALPCVRVAATDLPIRRLLALQERALAMISVDTGPAHTAAAVGCPVVVLFGAHAPAAWAPRSAADTPVIALGGPPVSADVRDIDPEAVIEAWRAIAEGRARGAVRGPARRAAP